MSVVVKNVITGEEKIMHVGNPREALLSIYSQTHGDLSGKYLEKKYGTRVVHTKEAILCGEWQVSHEGQPGVSLSTPRSVLLGNTPIDELHQLENERVLYGTVRFGGARLPLYLIEVSENVEGLDTQGVLGPVDDPENRWGVMIEAEPEGPFETYEVPGFPGKYVFYLTSGTR